MADGMVKLAEDFGQGEGGGMVDVDRVHELCDQGAALVAMAQADRCPWDSTKAKYQASMAQIMDVDIGPLADVFAQIKAAAPKVEPPPPPPPPERPAVLHGVAVTYQGHGQARDLYLGYTDEQVQWGRHDSLPIHAPAAGTVSLYPIGTPLGQVTAQGAEYTANYFALTEGWVCSLPLADLIALGQTMYVVVLVYDTPQQTSYGLVRADWAGHVRSAVKTGRVAAGEVYAYSGASGIQFERAGVPNARAAHIHGCASATGQLSPNGDLNGLAFAEVRGWKPIAFLGDGGPGPDQYLSGAFCAGRRLSDFTSAGKPIPPVAPD